MNALKLKKNLTCYNNMRINRKLLIFGKLTGFEVDKLSILLERKEIYILVTFMLNNFVCIKKTLPLAVLDLVKST
jgi:hypothetical protein